jgi:hypothetical protein
MNLWRGTSDNRHPRHLPPHPLLAYGSSGTHFAGPCCSLSVDSRVSGWTGRGERTSRTIALGFTGAISTVQRFVQSWRESPGRRVNGRHPPPLPLTPRQCSWLLTNPEHPRVTDEQRDCLRRLTDSSPLLAAAQNLALGFCHLVRNRGGSNGFAR